jgi:hypothetical protein
MTQQAIAYHRNFIVMYPFFSLAAAYGVTQTIDLVRTLFPIPLKNWQVIAGAGCILLAVLVLQMDKYRSIYHDAYTWYQQKETRTQAMDTVSRLVEADGRKGIVGVARELKVSEADLRLLKVPYRLFAHKDLKQAMAENTFLVVGHYRSMDSTLHAQDDSLNQMTKPVVSTIEGSTMYRDPGLSASQTPHMNPKIHILKGASYHTASQYPVPVFVHSVMHDLPWNAKVPIQSVQLQKTTYLLTVNTLGSPMDGVFPHIKVWLGGQVLSDYFLSAGPHEKQIRFTVPKDLPDPRTIYVEFDNDNTNGKEDRNARIDGVILRKYL